MVLFDFDIENEIHRSLAAINKIGQYQFFNCTEKRSPRLDAIFNYIELLYLISVSF